MRTGDFGVAAAFFTALGDVVESSKPVMLEKVGVIVEEAAKAAIGDPANGYGWAPLGPAALAKQGNTPLLDTGELRASYSHYVEDDTVRIGTPEMKGVWQEMGTSRGIPPRPVLAPSVIQNEDQIVKAIADEFEAVFTDGTRFISG